MPGFGTKYLLLPGIFLLSLIAHAQPFNLEYDLLGKPYQPQVVVSDIEGLENVPWLSEASFTGMYMSVLKNMPGMGSVVRERDLRSLRSPFRKDPYAKKLMGGKHYLIKTYVDGGAVIHLNNGNEILKFISYQIFIVNIATSEVEAVYRIECDSERFFETIKKRYEGKPDFDVLQGALLESVKEKMNKALKPFFYHLEPAVEIKLDEKSKKDCGIITEWKGKVNKDIVKEGYALAVLSEIPSSKGPIRKFISLGAVELSYEHSSIGKPFYRFISGRGRVEKALKLGLPVFVYPTNTVK